MTHPVINRQTPPWGSSVRMSDRDDNIRSDPEDKDKWRYEEPDKPEWMYYTDKKEGKFAGYESKILIISMVNDQDTFIASNDYVDLKEME